MTQSIIPTFLRKAISEVVKNNLRANGSNIVPETSIQETIDVTMGVAKLRENFEKCIKAQVPEAAYPAVVYDVLVASVLTPGKIAKHITEDNDTYIGVTDQEAGHVILSFKARDNKSYSYWFELIDVRAGTMFDKPKAVEDQQPVPPFFFPNGGFVGDDNVNNPFINVDFNRSDKPERHGSYAQHPATQVLQFIQLEVLNQLDKAQIPYPEVIHMVKKRSFDIANCIRQLIQLNRTATHIRNVELPQHYDSLGLKVGMAIEDPDNAGARYSVCATNRANATIAIATFNLTADQIAALVGEAPKTS